MHISKTEEPTATSNAEEEAALQMNRTYSRAMKYVCVLAFLLHVAFMSLFALNGVAVLAKINIISLLFFIGGFYAAHRNKPGITSALAGTEVTAHAIAATFIIGWHTGFHYYIILVVPTLVMSSLRPARLKVALLILAGLLYGGMHWALSEATPPHQLAPVVTLGLQYFNLASFLLVLTLMATIYYVMIKRANQATYSKTQDINNMLQNLPEGVLTVGKGLLIHHEYSAHLETILETKDIANQNVMALIFKHSSATEDVRSQVETALNASLGEDEINFEFNAHLLVSEMGLNMPDGRVKSLELRWSPILNKKGLLEKIMLCVRDVTDIKRLEAEAGNRKRELEIIGEILAVSQEKFQDFIESTNKFIDENRRLIQQTHSKREDTVNLLFRNMHTIKGNARTYALLYMTNLVHVTEQAYDELRKNIACDWDQPTLLAQLDRLQDLINQYSHINDTVLGRKGPGRRGQVEKFLMVDKDQLQRAMGMLSEVDTEDPLAMRAVLTHLGRTLHMVGTEPIEETIAGSLSSLPSLARELGKLPPQVHIHDHGIMIRTQISSLVKNLFTHLLRNALDHGLEKPSERLAAGKPEAGRIDIEVAVHDGQLCIRLRDDGRGLAMDRIRQRAIAQRLLTPDNTVSDHELAMMIFLSGFSTSETVTEISGRGVGMDAVKGFIEREGGHIEIRFVDEQSHSAFRAFETLIYLPDKFAASLDAAMSFEALRARVLAGRGASTLKA